MYAQNSMAPPAPFAIAIAIALLLLPLQESSGTVVLRKNGMSLEFKSKEAGFAPRVAGSGLCGYLISGNPLSGCSLRIKAKIPDGSCSSFVLLARGNCSFNMKIHKAQDAGFAAVIIFNDDDDSKLLTMSGDSEGVLVYAVFISKASGEMLLRYANDSDSECWILPTNEDAIWSVLIITFISLLAIATVLVTCYIIRRQRFHQLQIRSVRDRKSCGVSSDLVKAMPTIIFKDSSDVNVTEVLCPICLESYIEGEELRILPCLHQFHSLCVDSWLTMWQPFCPLCKQDVCAEHSQLLPSETTPLLNSVLRSTIVASTFVDQDAHTSLGESALIQTEAHSRNALSDSISNCYPNARLIFDERSQCPRSHVADNQSVNSYSFHNQSLWSGNGITHHAVDSSSLDAFRASPYFTSPSSTRNASPQISVFVPSPYLVNFYQGGEYPNSHEGTYSISESSYDTSKMKIDIYNNLLVGSPTPEDDYVNLQEVTHSIAESSHDISKMKIDPYNNSSEGSLTLEVDWLKFQEGTSITKSSHDTSEMSFDLYNNLSERSPTLDLGSWIDGSNHESPELRSRNCSSFESFSDYAHSEAGSDQEIMSEDF